MESDIKMKKIYRDTHCTLLRDDTVQIMFLRNVLPLSSRYPEGTGNTIPKTLVNV
jgi:hypothetical protein